MLNHKVYYDWLAYFEWWRSDHFQQSFSPIYDGIITLHNDITIYLVLVVIGLLYMSFRLPILNMFSNRFIRDHTFNLNHNLLSTSSDDIETYVYDEIFAEIIWTIFPFYILIFIYMLSTSFLYNVDNHVYFPAITVNVTGHQWYWTYEHNPFDVSMDSYMIPDEYLKNGELRLLEVDNRLLVPAKTHIRIFVTSDDVIHSWSVPSLGIKIDAVPGRINHCHIFVNKSGIFYGQCSELCGIGHNSMPIVIQALPVQFYNYIFHPLRCY